MATSIIVVAFIIEVAFVTSCLITKSDQEQAKSFLRIGVFAVFLLLAWVSVVAWRFRWYGLGVLLFVWAGLGTWALTGKKGKRKTFRSGRVIVGSIINLLLIVPAVLSALIFPQYAPPKMTGSHEVSTVHYTYTDNGRIETFTHTGLPLFSPFPVSLINNSVKTSGGQTADTYDVIETLNALVLQFFNVYLKGNGRFTAASTY